MKLENQLTSLEPSKRLKELGFKQESLFYWQKWTQSDWKLSYHKDFDGINHKGQVEVDGLEIIRDIANDTDDACSAYTIAELGKMLKPEIINKYLSDFCIENGVQKRNWRIIFDVDFWAKFIIYLKRNSLI